MAKRKRKAIPAPVRRSGARLYRFGDEDDLGIWYPDAEIVTDDEGTQWVATAISAAPPAEPVERAAWERDQRDLEQVAQRMPHRSGGIKGGKSRAGDNAAILDWARDQLAKDVPSPGPWALAGMLKGKAIARGLKQRRLYDIILPLFPQK